jgi:hypothetical protein
MLIVAQFSACSDLSSQAIKIFERGWPSHVDIVDPQGNLIGARSEVINGIPAGVQLRPPNYTAFSRVERVRLPSTPNQETAFWNFLEAQLGKPYDMAAITAFPLHAGWHTPGHWICSGLFIACLVAANWFPSAPLHDPEETTPFEALLMVTPWRVP